MRHTASLSWIIDNVICHDNINHAVHDTNIPAYISRMFTLSRIYIYIIDGYFMYSLLIFTSMYIILLSIMYCYYWCTFLVLLNALANVLYQWICFYWLHWHINDLTNPEVISKSIESTPFACKTPRKCIKSFCNHILHIHIFLLSIPISLTNNYQQILKQ